MPIPTAKMSRAPSFITLSLVIVLSVPTSPAQPSKLRNAFKQVVAQVRPPLQKIASNNKLAITVLCATTACVMHFATPPATPADYLSSDAELLRSGDARDIFSQERSVVTKSSHAHKPRLSFDQWLAKGIYHNSGDHVGVFRFGTKVKQSSLTAFLTIAYRYDLDNEGIDDIAVKTRTWGGLKGTLRDNGEEHMSYGYTSSKLSTSKYFRVYSTQNYLLSYRSGPLHIAGLGYEYVDTESKKLSGDEGADNVRSHGAALYRVGIKYPLTSIFTASNALAINLKLNSVLHLGDIGWATLGETWQDELNAWAGEDANLIHSLYHRAGGSINIELADGRLNLSLGGEIHHAIGGNIILADANGDFDLSYTILSVAGVFNLIPSKDIALSLSFGRYDQSVSAVFNGQNYQHDSWGTSGRVLLVKQKF